MMRVLIKDVISEAPMSMVTRAQAASIEGTECRAIPCKDSWVSGSLSISIHPLYNPALLNSYPLIRTLSPHIALLYFQAVSNIYFSGGRGWGSLWWWFPKKGGSHFRHQHTMILTIEPHSWTPNLGNPKLCISLYIPIESPYHPYATLI